MSWQLHPNDVSVITIPLMATVVSGVVQGYSPLVSTCDIAMDTMGLTRRNEMHIVRLSNLSSLSDKALVADAIIANLIVELYLELSLS